jgi:hypothetical protein
VRGDPRRAVPAGGEATDAEIGDEEIWVSGPRGGDRGLEALCCQGGVRICKDVAEDTEVVEEGLKREEIDVDDERRDAPDKGAIAEPVWWAGAR